MLWVQMNNAAVSNIDACKKTEELEKTPPKKG